MERNGNEMFTMDAVKDIDVDADVVDDVINDVKVIAIDSDDVADAVNGDDDPVDDADVEDDVGLNSLFESSNDMSDLRLIVQGRPLYVSRVVLSLVSPVMKSLFISKKADDIVEIEIPDKKYTDFVQFLSCVYPNTLAAVTAENVEVVLALADEYQVHHLIRKCELFLVTDIELRTPKPPPDKIVRYLNLSDKYGLDDLQRATFETAARTESDLLENVQDFWDLPSVTTTSVFIRRLKLLEKFGKGIRSKFKEIQNHCSLYHKGDRNGNSVCTKCNASIGKYTIAELKLV